jgi:hypothetical protein
MMFNIAVILERVIIACKTQDTSLRGKVEDVKSLVHRNFCIIASQP